MFFSDEETEAMPVKSVHSSGNQEATIATLLNRTGLTLPGFFCVAGLKINVDIEKQSSVYICD